MPNYIRGKLLAQGKTKLIWAVKEFNNLCIAESKDDITAGDGAKHDVMKGKGAMANQTTCDVFELLRRHDVPLAYHQQLDKTSFLAELCEMLPWEVVARRKAWGSYLKRFPEKKQGDRFEPVLVEFFLKTSGKTFQGHALPEDDPFALIDNRMGVSLYNPKLPMHTQEAFLKLPAVEGTRHLSAMERCTRLTFEVLEAAWAKVGGDLIDFKIEFGMSSNGLVVADVIDNDSWRVLGPDGQDISKQAYRDGASLDDVTAKYKYVMGLTSQF